MTWSGVGTSARPATDGTADGADDDEDADADEDEDPVTAGAPPGPHPVSTASATVAVAAHVRTFTPASVPPAPTGRAARCAGVVRV